MRCQNCGAELPDGAIYCTHCNRLNEKPNAKSKKRGETITIVMLVICWVLCLLWFGGKNPSMLFSLTAMISVAILSIRIRNK